ncbi:DUF397 domain-containing protein [Streptomyces sp. NPDC057702]|uniref:DUF397 domain-containing protein n=1 Tax=unclassified Streptomyces TaxID=2593676 RepID=UPI0036836F08
MTETWIKSSYSASNGGECIEWAPGYATVTGVVPVRDSKDPQGPALSFDVSTWRVFVLSVKAGEFGA